MRYDKNSTIVKNMVKKEILDSIECIGNNEKERLEAYYSQIKNIQCPTYPSLYSAIEHALRGCWEGFCLWNPILLNEFLKGLNIKYNSKSLDEQEKLYIELIYTNTIELWKKYGIEVAY